MEQWATKEEIIAARERMEGSHPGWVRPAAFAVGIVRDGGTSFGLTNVGGNYFPAIVLARVVGHASGTASYPLSRGQLETAVAELSPAEACTEFQHPNLVHWRALLDEAAERGGQFVAVFVADLDDPPADDHDRALRATVSN